MHVLDFLTELQNTEVSVTLLKSDCTTDALTAISKILGAYKGNTCGGASFRCRLDSSNFLKGTLLKMFL